MKKFLAFILALAGALSLMACGKKNNDDKPDPTPAPGIRRGGGIGCIVVLLAAGHQRQGAGQCKDKSQKLFHGGVPPFLSLYL